MKTRKFLSVLLALVMALALTVPAFAADTLNGNQLSDGEWNNGPSLTLTGVTGRIDTPIDPQTIYDVEVGGSLVLEMTYPAGKNRTYWVSDQVIYVYIPQDPTIMSSWEYKDAMGENWDLPASTLDGVFNASSGITRFVYTFTASDMGQKGGCDKVSYPYIYWYDDVNGDGEADSGSEGSAYFGVRVVPAQSSAPAQELPTQFSDVPSGRYFSKPVAWAVENKITDGVGGGKFAPGRTCTHGEIITFLWRAAGEPKASAQAPIRAGYAGFTNAINWAYAQGIIDASFQETAACNRASTVTYIWKAKGSPAASGANAFTDIPAGADYIQAVNWAVGEKVTDGTGDGSTFSPGDTCTRGEIVTFLERAFNR